MESPLRTTEPGTTLPVSWYDCPALADWSSCDGCFASVAALKLVYIRAPARSIAAVSATTSRTLRLRLGSIWPDYDARGLRDSCYSSLREGWPSPGHGERISSS